MALFVFRLPYEVRVWRAARLRTPFVSITVPSVLGPPVEVLLDAVGDFGPPAEVLLGAEAPPSPPGPTFIEPGYGDGTYGSGTYGEPVPRVLVVVPPATASYAVRPPGWTFVVADRSGRPIGRLNDASDRTVRLTFNGRVLTASARIDTRHQLLDAIRSGRTIIQVWEGEALRMQGALQSAEKVVEATGTVSCTWASPLAELARRLIGKTVAGYRDGTVDAQVDKSLLVANIVAAANASGWTGVSTRLVESSGSAGFLEFPPMKAALDALVEVVNQFDGPDVIERMVIPTVVAIGSGTATQLSVLDVVPVVGAARNSVIFEFNTGRRNVASWREVWDFQPLLNRAYGPPGSSAADGEFVVAEDATSQTTLGLAEGVVSSDLPRELRQRLVDEHVRVRKAPRQVLSFVPATYEEARPRAVPRFGLDYDLGDVITFRAAASDGTVEVNANMRVYAADWSINDEGTASLSLTLTPD